MWVYLLCTLLYGTIESDFPTFRRAGHLVAYTATVTSPYANTHSTAYPIANSSAISVTSPYANTHSTAYPIANSSAATVTSSYANTHSTAYPIANSSAITVREHVRLGRECGGHQ